MQLPHVRNTARDEQSDVTYHVMAYRKLSESELVHAVRYYQARNRRKPKRGSAVTIVSLIGSDE